MAKKKLPKELNDIVKEVQALSNELKEEEQNFRKRKKAEMR